MGCCFSAATTNHPPPPKPQPSSSSRSGESRAPPPSSSEEETVKEVLSSVTPTPKNCNNNNAIVPQIKVNDHGEPEQVHEEAKKFLKVEKMEPQLSPREEKETSELLSDICSLSESVSTITERRDYDDSSRDDGEPRYYADGSVAKFPAKSRSFSGDLGTRREKMVGKSPSKRFDQSPARRNAGSAKVVQCREQAHHQQMVRRRRDPGERSGRRYGSPATRDDSASNLSRVPSARRTNRSPGRVRRNPPENGNGKSREKNMEAGKESLENPLVSLECFIFL